MRIEDVACMARGFVSPSFLDISTGKRIPFGKRCNKLSYMSAEAMAAAFGGDPSYIPSRIGFIYGNQERMPSESPITRSQSWDMLKEELSYGGDTSITDVQIVGFSYSPTLGGERQSQAPSPESSSSDSSSSSSGNTCECKDDIGESSDYNNILPGGSNAITFHAVSNSQDVGSALGSGAFHDGDYIYQAVLMGCHNGKYYIISRVSLLDNASGKYLQKPDKFEVALDWTVVFY